jgi:hypothetical protein
MSESLFLMVILILDIMLSRAPTVYLELSDLANNRRPIGL